MADVDALLAELLTSDDEEEPQPPSAAPQGPPVEQPKEVPAPEAGAGAAGPQQSAAAPLSLSLIDLDVAEEAAEAAPAPLGAADSQLAAAPAPAEETAAAATAPAAATEADAGAAAAAAAAPAAAAAAAAVGGAAPGDSSADALGSLVHLVELSDVASEEEVEEAAPLADSSAAVGMSAPASEASLGLSDVDTETLSEGGAAEVAAPLLPPVAGAAEHTELAAGGEPSGGLAAPVLAEPAGEPQAALLLRRELSEQPAGAAAAAAAEPAEPAQPQGPSLLEVAEELERRLASETEPGDGGVTRGEDGSSAESRAAYHQDMLMASLVSQLEEDGEGPAPEDGHTDERGTTVGRATASRAFLSPAFEPLFRGPQHHGMPSALTKYRGMVAVGSSAGAIHVLMPAGKREPHGQPRLVEVASGASHAGSPGGSGAAAAAAAAAASGGSDGVTALCFGQHGGGSLLLLSGHASGALKIWELKTHLTGGVGWVLSKTLSGVHGSAVTACSVLEGGPTTWALSADAHGRLMAHNLSRHLSVAAQALTSFARQLTGGGSIPSHLISLQAAGQDPGVILGAAPLHGAPQRGPALDPAAAADLPAFLYIPELGHFVLLCATRAIMLCLLSQEGRMQVLHVFLPPLNTPADCSPYAAWRVEPQTATVGPAAAGPAVCAVVAVAWQASVSMYRAVLLWRRPAAASQSRRTSQQQQQPGGAPKGEGAAPPAQPLPLPALLNTWTLRNPVCGACFLEPAGAGSRALVVAAAAGETATELLVYPPALYTDSAQRLSQRPALAPRQQEEGGGSSEQGGGEAGAAGGEQGAGTQGAAGREATAAEAAVERMLVRDWVVGTQMTPVDAATFHSGISAFGEQALMLTSQGVRVVQLMTWQQRLSALVAQQRMQHALLAAAHIFHAAGQPPAAGAAAGQQWPADGAGAAPAEASHQLLLILCGLLDSRLAALAAGGAASAGGEGGGQQPGLPVEGGERSQQAQQAEWLAEVAINACLLLRRQDALLGEVFPRWQPTPWLGTFLQQLEPHILRDELPSLAPEVMQALVEHFVSIGRPEQVERCVLKMDILSLDLNQLIPLCLRHRLYGALLHIFTGAMQDYQTPASLLLVAAAAEMERQGAEAAPQRAQQSAQQGLEQLLEAEAGLRLGYKLLIFLKCCLLGRNYPPGCGPLPAGQQHAVKAQAVAFLLYATALSVWECWRLWGEMAHAESARSVAELPRPIADPHPALRLLCRMDAAATLGLLRRALHAWDAVEADLAEVVPSVAQQLPAGGGDRTMTQAVIDAVVELIETGALGSGGTGGSGAPEPAGGADAETTALQFVADHLAANRAVVPASIVMRVLAHLAAPQRAQHAQRAQQAEAVFRDVLTHAAAALSDLERQEAVWLARRAGYFQAEARVRELEGAHGEALACLTRDARHPEAPFLFVRRLLSDATTPEGARQATAAAALQQMPALMELNPRSAAQLVLDCFPDRQQAVLAGLAPTPRLQFAFLRALVELQQADSRDKRIQPLLADMAATNLFVQLLCQFDPGAVLPFLQSNDSYGVDECLRDCVRHKVQDGAAFLLERRGDVHSALKIYIQALEGANRALVEAVKSGGPAADPWAAALLAAPAGGTAGGRLTRRPTLLLGSPSGGGGAGAGAHHSAQQQLPELHAAQDALRNAIAVCIRFSQDHMGAAQQGRPGPEDSSAAAGVAGLEAELLAAAGVAAADPVQRLWFQVLQGYVGVLRELRKEEHRVAAAGGEGGLEGEGAAPAAAAPGEGIEERQRQHRRLLALQDVFTGFMEEVIRGMAGHVPMRAIAEAIIHQYSSDQFGDFKSTLLGLLAACNFELSILRCANRVVGSDGARILAGGYRDCSRPEGS